MTDKDRHVANRYRQHYFSALHKLPSDWWWRAQPYEGTRLSSIRLHIKFSIVEGTYVTIKI